jgi:POT family proton-dependent oligopeptide transporter
LLLLSAGYGVIAIGVHGVDASTKVSIFWLVSLYFIHTCGELSLSPIGLSMVTKLSPLRMGSLMMGVWYLSTAAANKMVGVLSSLMPGTDGQPTHFLGFEIDSLFSFFLVFVVMAGIAGIALLFISPYLNKMMNEKDE